MDLSLAGSAFHSQVAVATRALNFHPRNVGFEGEEGIAGTAFQIGRTVANTRNQHR